MGKILVRSQPANMTLGFFMLKSLGTPRSARLMRSRGSPCPLGPTRPHPMDIQIPEWTATGDALLKADAPPVVRKPLTALAMKGDEDGFAPQGAMATSPSRSRTESSWRRSQLFS